MVQRLLGAPLQVNLDINSHFAGMSRVLSCVLIKHFFKYIFGLFIQNPPDLTH